MRSFLKWLHYFVSPHEKNNFRARALHINSLTAYLLFAILMNVLIGQVRGVSGNVLGYATDISVEKLYELTNKVRTENGKQPLEYNKKLEEAARAKALDMFKKNYWSHFGPDGESPWQFIAQAGYSYDYAGENLAKNFSFSQDVVTAWINSPSHKENLLRDEYTQIGFAVVNGHLTNDETTLVVQMFGKPAAVAAQPVQIQQPTEPQIVLDPAVLAQTEQKPLINLFSTSYFLNILFIILLVGVLAYDFYITAKLSLHHTQGKHLAHIIFVLFILGGIIFLTKGTIL